MKIYVHTKPTQQVFMPILFIIARVETIQIAIKYWMDKNTGISIRYTNTQS